jgi:flagellar biosynthetic protein FlhB
VSSQDFDRNEPATPQKLRDAHDRGQVARSPELTGMAVVTVFVVVALATLDGMGTAFRGSFQRAAALAGQPGIDANRLGEWALALADPLLLALSPALLAVLVAAVVGNVVQTGPVFSWEPLSPDLDRINPANGLQRMFSLRTLYDLGKVVLKLLALCGVGYAIAHGIEAACLALAATSPGALPDRVSSIVTRVVVAVLTVLLLSALLDFAFARYEFARKMRMSRRELKDEYRRREGDPEIRSKRRRLQAELMRRIASVRRVRDADVVVTNPTHLAVALQYRPARMLAPRILALGADTVAARIRAEAARHAIPVVQNVALARALFAHGKVDAPVAAEHYQAIAPLYRWLMARPDSKVALA